MSWQDALADPAAEALALLDAVVVGELLAALPPEAIDRERHAAAVRLIGLARLRLLERQVSL